MSNHCLIFIPFIKSFIVAQPRNMSTVSQSLWKAPLRFHRVSSPAVHTSFLQPAQCTYSTSPSPFPLPTSSYQQPFLLLSPTEMLLQRPSNSKNSLKILWEFWLAPNSCPKSPSFQDALCLKSNFKAERLSAQSCFTRASSYCISSFH